MEVNDILNRINYPLKIREWLDELIDDIEWCQNKPRNEKLRLCVLDEFWSLAGDKQTPLRAVDRIELLELYLIEKHPESEITDCDRLQTYINLIRYEELFPLLKFIPKNNSRDFIIPTIYKRITKSNIRN